MMKRRFVLSDIRLMKKRGFVLSMIHSMMKRRFVLFAIIFIPCLVSRPHQGSTETTRDDTILSISVFGNVRVRDELILMKLGLEPGDSFSNAAVSAGIQRIKTLYGIDTASSRTVQNKGEEGKRLIIIVTEKKTRSIKPLVRRTFANKIAFGAAAEETNFRGWNERIELAALFHGATILTGSWYKPYAFGTPYLAVGTRAAYRLYDYPFRTFEALLVDDDVSWGEAALSLCFCPTEYFTFFLSPGVDRIELADSMLIGQGNSDVPPAPSGTFSTFETGIRIDMLDRDFYPRNGMLFTASRKDWGVLQENAAMKNFLYRFQGLFFLKLGRALLSFDARGTFVQGRVPIILFQHLGGEETIRGYDFAVFSGENSLLGRTEVRIPLNFNDLEDLGNPMVLVDFNIFLDSGACWNASESFDTDRFHSGFGCGLNFIPIENRLIKVGYAWRRETSGMWYFDVGTMF